MSEFGERFWKLTGNCPFPWQTELYKRFAAGAEKIPSSCAIPTGLGKTAIMHIWLLALAAIGTSSPAFPRRLVYVVNRRTIVDQATREAESLRAKLKEVPNLLMELQKLCATDSDIPLAISTLRGQFADNGEWSADPTRPAIIVGTVDMIGSRLLFSGYGRGFKHRPLHAGFLGQNVLLVHDEAHLEPAFQELLEEIEKEQKRCRDFCPMRVTALTATPREGENRFELTNEDFKDKNVVDRLIAKKAVLVHAVGTGRGETATRVAELTLSHEGSGSAILVFLRTIEDVQTVRARLPKDRCQVLTGTLRGLERDQLATSDKIFARFLPPPKPGEAREAASGTVYLVCTSAGEVGVDISADHLVCDLTPFESMAQRFGRVNRYGGGDARIDIVHPAEFDDKKEFEVRRQRTLTLLQRLNGDGSPKTLDALPLSDRLEAFTPKPKILPVNDILFDAWALTTIRDFMPGRPPVADWLHGVAEWEPPETWVAWRNEVDAIGSTLMETNKPDDMLDDYPLKPHEMLQDRTDRVLSELVKLAIHHGEKSVWIVGDTGVMMKTLQELADGDPKNNIALLKDRTVLLPPLAGGLQRGMLTGSENFAVDVKYDVADEWYQDREQRTIRRRQRTWNDMPNAAGPSGMRLVRRIDTKPEIDIAIDEEEGDENREVPTTPRFWNWWVRPRSADDDMSKFGMKEQALDVHLADAERYAQRMVEALGLGAAEAKAVVLAAKWHDLGKHRAVWQRSIGNDAYFKQPPMILAKSGATMRPVELSNYRHEFGSLMDICKLPEFSGIADEEKELLLHLVAAHHGRARPHFSNEETFDPENNGVGVPMLARKIPLRLARLQRQYGRWGLAYLESLVRAADILASQTKDKDGAL